MEVVDLMTGAHLQEPYISLNPNGLVPTLVDGDFVLDRELVDHQIPRRQVRPAAYPKDLKERAKVNELMDWFNTGFYRDYAYGVVYPQIFPHHKRPSDELQKGTIEWGKGLTKKWLKVLNDHWLGKGNKYLTGDQLTIADYFGAGAAHLRPCHPRRVQGLSEHRGLAEADRRTAQLEQDQRGDERLPRVREGPAVRHGLLTLAPTGSRHRHAGVGGAPGIW